MTRYLTLICYDVEDDSRRKRVSDQLEQWGTRVNYSVFECMLSDRERLRLLLLIESLVDIQKDCVLSYVVCRKCYLKYDCIGKPHTPPLTGRVIGV